MSGIDGILQFWFDKEDESGYGEAREESFAADPEFDRRIRDRFLETYGEALVGNLDHWLDHPRSALALTIVLDQFPRNMFRGTPQMYAADRKALAVANEALARGYDGELSIGWRWFLFMPFHHSEDMEDQRRSVELFRSLGEYGEAHLGYAKEHKQTIERFGRFPHRNEILGRENTAEEMESLR